jgi:nucleoside-diphosphate-sugar epimerase
MRIFITGGSGLIGRAVAARLLDSGHEVHLTDLAPETDAPHTTYARCDIMDFDALCEQMRGCDAVVHMAALKNPLFGPGQDIFRINAAGTYNVFEAAAKSGIRRVIQASSINAIGCAWNIVEFTPAYLPVDEAHPVSTTDPYSFSKQTIEEIGTYYWRRDGISSIAMRLPGIYRAGVRQTSESIERRRSMRELLDTLAALPEAEQQHQLAAVREQCLAFRAKRPLEYPEGSWKIPPVDGIDPRLSQMYTFDRYNLWASLEERDVAIAVEQSLTADFEGSHALFVNDTHNSLDYDSPTLARLFYPGVPQNLTGSESLVSVSRARELIGFEPRYSVHEKFVT